MLWNCTLLIVLFTAVTVVANDLPPAYWPPRESVDEALAEFERYPKQAALLGLNNAERVEAARARWEPGDPPPDAALVEYWSSKTDEELRAMIPEDNPRALVPNYNQGCPIHHGNLRTLRPVWGEPNTWYCTKGDEMWSPGMEIENPGTGETVTVDDDGDGWIPPEGFPYRRRLYLKAAYRMFLIRMVIAEPYQSPVRFDGPDTGGQTPPIKALAFAWAVTRNKLYAQKAVVLLDELANNYRHLNGRIDTKVDWRVMDRRGYIGDGVFENFHVVDIANAYDLVFDAIDDEQQCRHIERNLFGYMWEYLKRMTPRGTANGRMFGLEAMGHLALVFRNDAIMETLIDGPAGIRHGVMGAFYRDGRSHEDSSSYSRSVNNTYLEISGLVSNYSGREIYTDGFDARTEFGSRIPRIEWWMEHKYFDGGYFPYGDGGNDRYELRPNDRELEPYILGHEVGFTIMRAGTDYRTRKNVLLYHSNSGVGHGHLDQLMLKILAYGYDFTGDIGYPSNLGSHKRRDYVDNSINHPVVIVDEKGQRQGACATAEFFAANDWAKAAAAYSDNTYDNAEQYHRTAVLVEVNNDQHFVIDLFRVRGGSQHDYIFHSHSGEDGRNFEVSRGDFTPQSGTLAGPDTEYGERSDNGYTYIRDVATAPVSDTFTATWRTGDENDTGYKLHMLGSPGRTLITARGEGRGTIHQSPYDAYLFVRQKGAAPLSSTYVAVHEPFQGEDLGLQLEAIDGGVRITTRDGEVFTLRQPETHRLLLEGPRGRLAVNWDRDPLRGRITEVDYPNKRFKVATDADLSDIAGKVIYIDNPGYVKATAFDVASIERAGDGEWWITTVLEPILATNTIREIDGNDLVSPYNMAKQRECPELFDGKPITPIDDPTTGVRLRSVQWVRSGDLPTQRVTLPDASLFANEGVYAIYDYAPGDTWTINVTTSE